VTILIYAIVFALGVIILVFRLRLGEWAEENWGHLQLPPWPGYLRAQVFLLGLIFTFAGLWFLVGELLNWIGVVYPAP
jgi:hypothetical protein